ncbi:MAG: choice-of-anchor A family protein, partial [Melioribacteraceae bacterium]|nr:choice-of-anchor A family protein [Melioribacteraceae bacterium]
MGTTRSTIFKTIGALFLTTLMVSNIFAGDVKFNAANSNGDPNGIESAIAKITGTDIGATVHFTDPFNYNNFAGTFKGNVDGDPARFYCIDLNHGIAYNQNYIDAGNTPPEITYVLNNYYPYKSYPYSGALPDVHDEAAAIQSAIWHFSDGLNLSTLTPGDIQTRALEIVQDANDNAGSTTPVKTLVIVPVNQNLLDGTTATFQVEAYDESNAPVENVEINLTTSSDGLLSPMNIFTDASGVAGPITLTHVNDDFATVTATAEVVIPQGTKFVHQTNPDGKQKLVLATPSFTTMEVEATVTWYSAADLMIIKTASNLNPDDEEIIFYTLTVTNNGPSDATNIVVSDILPAGLDYQYSNPADYNPITGIWTVGDIASGNSKSIDIYVKIDYQSLSLTPSFDLGIAADYNLFVLKDVDQPSSDTQGKMAVGRNASLSNYSVGDQLPPSGGTEDVLIVGRKLTFTSGAVYGGNVVYGKFIDIPQYGVSVTDGTIRQEDPVSIDFAQAAIELTALSSQLAGYPINGTTTMEYGGLKLNGDDPV